MKKFVSFVMSAALAVSSLSARSVSAADGSTDKKDLVLFGDSISAGYGLSSTEHSYGEICADYLGGTVNNYAHSGDTSEDMLTLINGLSSEQKQAVKDAEVVVISIGGNDLMHYASAQLLDYAAKRSLLKDGLTANDIPADPSISTLLVMLDVDKVKAYANGGPLNVMDLNAKMKNICADLRFATDERPGIIKNTIMANLTKSVAAVKAINPDARILVQTIYQPIQLDPEYVKSSFPEGESIIDSLRMNFKDVLDTFAAELKNVEGIEIADVAYDFTSIPAGEKSSASNPGHANYFTNVQLPMPAKDFHPNQKGHLAIAAVVLKQIGDLHDDKGMLSATYKSLRDQSDYPLVAIDTYKTVAGNNILGDINFDEKVDARDASMVLKDYANKSGNFPSVLSTLQNKAADVDGDGMDTATDAAAILRYYAYASTGGTEDIAAFIKSSK